MQITNKEKKATKFGIFIFVTFILGSGLFIGFQVFNKQSSAIGGGFRSQTTNTVTVNATTITAGTGSVFAVKGNYIVLGIASFNPSITVTSVTDTQSDTYVKAIRSDKYEDAEIWYANYTGTNFGGTTVTVTFSSSTSSALTIYWLTGVTTGVLQVISGNGTATSSSVASFTPNTNTACEAFVDANSGSATGTTFGTPNFWQQATAVHLGALTFDTNTISSNNWANYGATTASMSMTPTSSPQWDQVLACFPEGTTTTATSTTTSTTTFTGTTTLSTATITTGASGGGIVSGGFANTTASTVTYVELGNFAGTINDGFFNQDNYIWAIMAFQIPNVHITSVTDNQSDVWHLALQQDHNYDIEYWYAHYTGALFASNDKITFNFNTSTTYIYNSGFMTGINTTSAPNIFTSVGFGTITNTSVAQFNPPSHSVCQSEEIFNAGTTNALSIGNIPYWDSRSTITGTGSINTFSTTVWRAFNWNFSDGPTTVSASHSATGLSPTWDKIAVCFQTGQTQFVTTTSTSTTTTSTQSTTTTTIFTNTTTTSTSTFSSTTTLTSTNTSFVTSTGTVIPEPLHSTDLLLILLAILIFLILIVVGLIKRNPFPTFLGATVLLIMNVGLYTNNLIVYGQNLITTPIWVNEMISLLVVFAFMLVIYQLIKRRY